MERPAPLQCGLKFSHWSCFTALDSEVGWMNENTLPRHCKLSNVAFDHCKFNFEVCRIHRKKCNLYEIQIFTEQTVEKHNISVQIVHQGSTTNIMKLNHVNSFV